MGTAIASFITWMGDLVNNFGLGVMICVGLAVCALTPFNILKSKHAKKKKKLAPKIKEIQKKYGANALGVSSDTSGIEDEEIRKLSVDERDEAMRKEISAAYKEEGFRAFVGWIPGFLVILLVIMFYSGISKAAPEGFYRTTFSSISGAFSTHINETLLLSSVVWVNIGTGLIRLFEDWMELKKLEDETERRKKKSGMVAQVASLVATSLLMTWIASKTTVALALAISSFHLFDSLKGRLFSLFGETED